MVSGPVLLILRIALALSLYAFVGWALYTIWSDLGRHSRQVTSRQAPPITLVYQIDGQERSQRFSSQEVTLGRDPAADLQLHDPTISAQHSRLTYHHGQWWIEDLHSTNGTYLNQEPVHEPLVIASGDIMRCGQVDVQISLGKSSSDEGETYV